MRPGTRTVNIPQVTYNNKNRIIKVCAGIGDNIWLLQKLLNTHEKFNFSITGDVPQRGKQIFDLCPMVVADSKYDFDFTSDDVINKSYTYNSWTHYKHHTFFLSMNTHLEEGNRIEEFIPDLETTFYPQYNTISEKPIADHLLKDSNKKYVGIYTSGYSVLRHWNFWREYEWFKVIQYLFSKNSDYVFVLLGAEYDLDINANLLKLLDAYKIPYVNTVGQLRLGTVVEVMKRLHYFLSFPSGLGILATTLKTPTLMFYPPHLEKMINTWAHPADIYNLNYKGMLFCEPEEALTWIETKYRLFDR